MDKKTFEINISAASLRFCSVAHHRTPSISDLESFIQNYSWHLISDTYIACHIYSRRQYSVIWEEGENEFGDRQLSVSVADTM